MQKGRKTERERERGKDKNVQDIAAILETTAIASPLAAPSKWQKVLAFRIFQLAKGRQGCTIDWSGAENTSGRSEQNGKLLLRPSLRGAFHVCE